MIVNVNWKNERTNAWIDRFELHSWTCMKTNRVSLFIGWLFSRPEGNCKCQTEFAEPTLKIIPGSELWKWQILNSLIRWMTSQSQAHQFQFLKTWLRSCWSLQLETRHPYSAGCELEPQSDLGPPRVSTPLRTRARPSSDATRKLGALALGASRVELRASRS